MRAEAEASTELELSRVPAQLIFGWLAALSWLLAGAGATLRPLTFCHEVKVVSEDKQRGIPRPQK